MGLFFNYYYYYSSVSFCLLKYVDFPFSNFLGRKKYSYFLIIENLAKSEQVYRQA